MLTLSSPAKINFFLKVVGRRPDGYHEIASLFQAIDLADTLHITLTETDALTSTSRDIPTDGTNLILKAADLFRQKTGRKFGLSVHLVKGIPHQAGLGGGSSNAATTLKALNQLCGDPATPQQLMQWGAELGSDIPFFFSNGTAYCTGRGEIVQELAPLPSQQVWIVKPTFGLSTQEVYSNVDRFSSEERQPPYNDLEHAAFKVAPQLAQLKEELQKTGAVATLSGSGSAFFCLGKEPPRLPDTEVYPSKFI